MESFYKDPEKDLNDPEVCLPCDCNLDGTIPFGDTGDTSCVSIPEEGEIPGQCNCKTHVAGRQCDHCAPGWLVVCQRLKYRRTPLHRLLELHNGEPGRMPTVHVQHPRYGPVCGRRLRRGHRSLHLQAERRCDSRLRPVQISTLWPLRV